MGASPILLTTINASYQHTAFGLRYLLANLGALKPEARIVEFTLAQNPRDIAEAILKLEPKIVGIGVYIWNTRQTLEVVAILRQVSPQMIIILGGPEISFETEHQRLTELADFVIQGEGETLFREVCTEIREGSAKGWPKILSGPLPSIQTLAYPYDEYTDEDIRQRVVYVEASRGCPFKCEFCLSSLDSAVRAFPLSSFLEEMDKLIQRGARTFKFVDRTFNLNIETSRRILEFFLNQKEKEIFVHFEIIPDRLPNELRSLIQRFSKGSLQFEIGIQSWNAEVNARISRRQDYRKVVENLKFLTQETGVHIHTDLIAGLPGETLASIAKGFDTLAALEPHEIQLGILKRLKGTPITRHDLEWEMAYDTAPPFAVLRTKELPYSDIQHLSRLSRFWDKIGNSGNFPRTLRLLKEIAHARPDGSLFFEFWELTSFLHRRHRQSYAIALLGLVESLWLYLSEERQVDPQSTRQALRADYAEDVIRDVPKFLRVEGERARSDSSLSPNISSLNARQRRHQRRPASSLAALRD